MTYWSGETLKSRLGKLVSDFDEKRIDGAAYRLSLGPEIFVTTDRRYDDSAEKGLRIDLEKDQQCRIPPGQFAFLLTEEFVKIPDDALGFISIRASYKFKGLVNVSGFHVDPGWDGRLVFSVYNAGPSPIVLSRTSELFLLWYASLDQKTSYLRNDKERLERLDDELIANMSGQVFSPIALSKDVVEIREGALDLKDTVIERTTNLNKEIIELRSEHNFYKKLVWLILGVLATSILKAYLFDSSTDKGASKPAIPLGISEADQLNASKSSSSSPPITNIVNIEQAKPFARPVPPKQPELICCVDVLKK